VITGISPATAMTIVNLGVDLSMMRTGASLAEGLKLSIDISNGGGGKAR
jgi:anti-anti-sigma regulatory factor